MKKNKRIGIISEIDYANKPAKILYWSLFALMCIIAFVCIAPPIWVILSSLKDTKEFYAIPPTIIPRSFNPEKIVEAWNTFDFSRYYLNTIIVTAGAIIMSVVCNGLAGFVLSKLKPKGSGLVFALILGSMMVPNTVSMVPVYQNIVSFPILGFNMINTFWPMMLMAGCNAFQTIVYKSFFDGIPSALIEAGKIDGCNEIQSFIKIVIPLSKAVVFTSMILPFNAEWGSFFWPFLVLRDKEVYTVIVEVFKIRNSIAQDQVLMILSFAIIPPAIMFMIFQKNIMQGLTMSGIKG